MLSAAARRGDEATLRAGRYVLGHAKSPGPSPPAGSSRTDATVCAIAIIRYRRPLEDILAGQDEHRAYLRGLHEAGTLLAAGPKDPRSGGMLLLRVSDTDAA